LDNPALGKFSPEPAKRQLQAQMRLDFAPFLQQMQEKNVEMLNEALAPILQSQGMDVVFRASTTNVLSRVTQELGTMGTRIELMSRRNLTMEAQVRNLAAQGANTSQSMAAVIQSMNNRDWGQTARDRGIEGVLDDFITELVGMYSSRGTEDPTYKHLLLVKATVLLAVAPVTNIIKLFGGVETNVGETIWNFINAWVKSTLGALKDLISQTVAFGRSAFKMFVSGLNISQAFSNFSNLVNTFIYYSVSVSIITTQLEFLTMFVGMFDSIGGTEYAPYLEIVQSEFLRFCWGMISDAFFLPSRVVQYVVGGVDEITGEETTYDLLMGDKKLWYIARYFVQLMENMFEPLIKMIVDNPSFKQGVKVANWTSHEVTKGWRFYKYYLNKFQRIMDKLLKEALNALKKAWDVGSELPDRAYSEMLRAQADAKQLVVLGSTKLEEVKTAAYQYLYNLLPDFVKRGKAIKGMENISTANLRAYNVLSVCGMLGITESAFNNLKDKKMVKYVKENPLNGFELLYVLHSAHTELTTPLLLRF
jgi:hypothetical protein